MRYLLLFLLSLCLFETEAQVVLSGNPTYTDACPSTNYTSNPCGNGNYYLGDNTIKLRAIAGSGTTAGKLVLFVSKCDGSALSSGLLVYLKKRTGNWNTPTDILCQPDFEEGWTYGTGGGLLC